MSRECVTHHYACDCREQLFQEMLEALSEAEDFINRHSEEWYLSGQALLAKVRAAIAKAKP